MLCNSEGLMPNREIAELDDVLDVSFTQGSWEEGLATLVERWRAS
jgi:hypothetical protein